MIYLFIRDNHIPSTSVECSSAPAMRCTAPHAWNPILFVSVKCLAVDPLFVFRCFFQIENVSLSFPFLDDLDFFNN